MITYRGRRAWQIENAQLRVTILECGAHVAENLHKPTGDLNPLWIQNRATIDSDQVDPAIHGDLYGTDAEARLISGLLGHNVCFPFWGSPFPTEEAAGMTLHGETNILRWERLADEAHSLKVGVALPNSSIRFERKIRCVGNLIYFSEIVQKI